MEIKQVNTEHLSVHSEWVGGLAASASKLSTKTECRYPHCAPERRWRRNNMKYKPYEPPNQAEYFRLQETCLRETYIASPSITIRNIFSSSRSKAKTQIPSAVLVTDQRLPNPKQIARTQQDIFQQAEETAPYYSEVNNKRKHKKQNFNRNSQKLGLRLLLL
jgi:hypothetical protein